MRLEKTDNQTNNKEIRKESVTPSGFSGRSSERISSFPEPIRNILPSVMEDILSRIEHA